MEAFMFRTFLLGLVGLIASTTAGAADEERMNAVYERFIAAYAALDVDLLMTAYDDDAVYLRSSEAAPAIGEPEIRASYNAFFGHVRNDGERMRISFRIIDRKMTDELASDVGYYRLERIAADGTEIGAFYGRFLTVLAPQSDGEWAFANDLDTTANAELWEAAKPVKGAMFAAS